MLLVGQFGQVSDMNRLMRSAYYSLHTWFQKKPCIFPQFIFFSYACHEKNEYSLEQC